MSVLIDLQKNYIGFTRGTGWISRKIREITKGEVNHVFLIIKGIVYQSHFKPGVHSISWSEYKQSEFWNQEKIILIETKQSLREDAAKVLVESELQYDPTDIREHFKKHVRPFSWRHDFEHQCRSKMICSEFVDVICNYAFSKNLGYCYPGEVNPQEIYEICKKNEKTQIQLLPHWLNRNYSL
jgi:hypothetical protein